MFLLYRPIFRQRSVYGVMDGTQRLQQGREEKFCRTGADPLVDSLTPNVPVAGPPPYPDDDFQKTGSPRGIKKLCVPRPFFFRG